VDQQRVDAPLYRPYNRLVEITIRGKKFSVPENNILLRAFQYLAPDTIPYGRYCWNEECQYCRVGLSRPGEEKIHQSLSCKTMVEDGMVIHELATELTWNLRHLFRPPGPPSSSPENR
jgi:predicted molibdopterin-dependent oxidoreductase YjgC